MAITKEVRLRALAEAKALGIEAAAHNAGVAIRTLQSWAHPDYEEKAERNALEKKALQMRPVIITSPRCPRNKIAPNDDGQRWLFDDIELHITGVGEKPII